MSGFLHGVEIQELDLGPRPISGGDTSVIGLVGTAKKGVALKGEPILIAGSRKEAVRLFGAMDSTATEIPEDNTLPYALNAILDQTGAQIVIVAVATGEDGKAAEADIQAGIDLFLAAESSVHKTPRILVAPGFSNLALVSARLTQVAERLRGIAIIDGPNTDNKTAIKAASTLANPRAYLIDPQVKVSAGGDTSRLEPASPRVAGVMAKSDAERGFWWSPSNRNIAGIIGTSRPVDFALGDVNATANLLNEGKVATIIHQNGYRLWGNRSCAADVKWAFISVRRTADLINDALQRSHMWAVDRNITKTYVEDVTEGVNAYLRHLKKIGAIINGKCWTDPEINTWDQVVAGKVTFDFDFTAPYPAEHITFRSSLVNDYIQEIFA
ncbi:phage tail sheath C-terminal domain-containing protein [Teredinibacter franksiae]|jgi:Phage tail sheath protein FI|uniref:phage tail sheath C-terminal domain-containing protein n=1 Tax=Teredinibacter franksiae TaxID=2761453 RepID=UPI001629CD6E|nr:phage tail sheath C-terminal domain-containing protein [Teredinibacter franksiae]